MTATAERASGLLFHALVVVGAVAASALALVEAGDKPPVEVVETFDEVRVDDAWVVEATVRNRSDVPRCPEVRVAARDTEARDLDEAVASAVEGDGAIAPGATARFRATLDELSDEEYAEELEAFSAYVYDDRACAPAQGDDQT